MAKLIARNASLYVDNSSAASKSITGLTNSITLSWSAEAPEVTGFGDSTRQRLPDGLKDYELTFAAFHATAANETDSVLVGILGGSTRFKFGPAGSTTGCTMYTGCTILTDVSYEYGVEGAGTVSGTMISRAGSLSASTF